MDMYDSMFSSNYKLIDQIAQQIFDILPERGPIMAIIDKEGNLWLSHQEEFGKLNINESFLRELCGKVDDGAEPVITQVGGASITAAQLFTERSNCGYVIIVLPQYSPESTLINIDLIETLLRQSVLIAELMEKNNLLHELQTKLYSVYGKSEAPSN
ncbi:MAG: hypothetical protein ACE5NM_05340 [Sedimentisphaerales bacterium]